MRISTSTLYSENVTTLNQLQVQIAQTQQQVSTGKRILNPADDPAAAARVVELGQSDSANTQYMTNRTAALNTLSLSEGILQSVTTLLQDAKTAAVNAGNSAMSQADRRSIANDLQGRFQELLGLANSSDGTGSYLFSGAQGSVQPFASTAAGVVYQGDDIKRNVQVSASRQLAATDVGNDIFMRVRNGNGTFVTASSTAAQTLSTNASIAAGAPGSTVTVASTNSLVVGMPISGGGFPAGTTVASIVNGTTFTTSAPAAVVPAAAQTIQFGGANAGSGVVSPGVVLNPALYNGNKYQISFAVSATVPPVTTYTVTDVTVPTAPAAVAGQTNVPYVSGQSISFNGIQFDIKGVPANGDVFTIAPSTNQSIFTTLSNLIASLNAPIAPSNVAANTTFQQGVSDALGNLDQGINNILSVRASLGGRMREIDALNVTGDELSLQYKQTMSLLQDVDYNKAVSDLTQQHFTLQAAQQSFAQISKMSLFNYI